MQTTPVTADVPHRVTEHPQLGVAAAARRLGVAPATLRTWDRRYGIGPSQHVPGRHRRYSPDDIARLDLMQHALVRGASPADAARFATVAGLTGGAPGPVEPAPPRDEPAAAGSGIPDGALPLPGADRRAQGLARAAMMLDPASVRALLIESVAAVGIEATWDDVVRPVLNAMSDRWQQTGVGVEVEHHLSGCVTGVFGQYSADADEADARPVLLAGMPGEQHMLPMVVLAATLAAHRVPCRMLGANLPVVGLTAAIRRTAPSLVVLWALAAEVADVEVLVSLPRTRPRFRIAAAGPGWAGRELPRGIDRLESLATARHAVTEMVPV